MTFVDFLQQLVNGLSQGAFYALIALGYTMVYGVLRFINFAHGDVLMVGAFIGYFAGNAIMPHLSGPAVYLGFVAVLGLAMAGCAALGVIIERLAYRPLRNRPRLTVLITAIGVSLFLSYGGQFLFGASPKPFPALLPESILEGFDGQLFVSTNQILALALTVVLLVALRFVVMNTRMGMAMRAVSHNPQAAALMGVNVDRVISFTFALGSALAGAAGVLYSMTYASINPLMGLLPGIKAFVAAVLGGIGNIPGAAVGGFVIGMVETFVGGSQWSTYKDALAFGILILILLFRPAGLFGKYQAEKV